jgi:hypothetical protein
LSKYPHARAVLTARIVQLHGTQHRLAQLLGISRQLLLTRQTSACQHPNAHPWWCNLLIMEPTWLLEEVQERPMPNTMLVAAAVELNQTTYDQHRRQGGRPRKVKP